MQKSITIFVERSKRFNGLHFVGGLKVLKGKKPLFQHSTGIYRRTIRQAEQDAVQQARVLMAQNQY